MDEAQLKKEIEEAINGSGCAASEPFALQVMDNSMEPEFEKGCIIVIDPSGLLEHESYVIAQIENGFVFRQLSIENDRYYIQPLHPDYMHEKREIQKEYIQGRIVQKAGAKGRRSDRKKYL